MTTTTVLLLLLSVVLAGGVAFFQYIYKASTPLRVKWVLAFLRFCAVLGLLLLLLNPRLTHRSFETIKTPLPIVVDNSSSIKELNAHQSALEILKKLLASRELQDKYEVQTFQFAADFAAADRFSFTGTQTRIDLVGKALSNSFKRTDYPAVILTDGNQTQGNDYVYSFDENKPIYPVVLGDTTSVLDVKIDRLNVNNYAFLKNKFPVEIFLSATGTPKGKVIFSISQGQTVLNRQEIVFSSQQKSQVVTVLLPAEKVGVQSYKAAITITEKEKNTYNNRKNFVVEVIDQKAEIALVSAISHPDLGALKRAIETNQQRKVSLLKPNQINSLQDFTSLIYYQPTAAFTNVFDLNKVANLNVWIITGLHTDYQFLNQQQAAFDFKMTKQSEDYLATFSSQFNLFALDNIGFERFPPLQNLFGTITAKMAHEKLIGARIRNVELEAPLLTFTENQQQRTAFLFGENLWKWRLQSHVDNQNFENFDIFIDKTIQFLTSNKARKSLVVTHENFYNSADAIEINAQYFNKNDEFDDNARLSITVKNKATNQTKSYDLLKSTNSYKVNLDGLAAGNYTFTVTENNTKTSYTSFFEVLGYSIEKQFVVPDYTKLSQLATRTTGNVFLAAQADQLIQTLVALDQYTPIQKEVVTRTPLIDWIWLLVVLISALASEWFIRKYYGMV